jgi:TonB family protein
VGDPRGTVDAPWYDSYIGIQLKKNWARPTAEGTLFTLVSVRILADGTVQFVRISRSSGNSSMDQSVVDAVQSVKKLGNPPPPGLPNPYDRVVRFEL